jgi:hypothetical protein
VKTTIRRWLRALPIVAIVGVALQHGVGARAHDCTPRFDFDGGEGSHFAFAAIYWFSADTSNLVPETIRWEFSGGFAPTTYGPEVLVLFGHEGFYTARLSALTSCGDTRTSAPLIFYVKVNTIPFPPASPPSPPPQPGR